ncbi:MAG: 7-carboxy-7-deazaguanine synthase QueE [Methanomethylovorans sp.]|uniref:7-carboxy-7-deazaguanine synthase QueE n=1 Tax=Methanomethylovorans sp. TaxID=2758717 RepID=UPI003C70C4EE
MEAPITEIFCSVQGEGPYVGNRQAFLRFAGCNLNCSYCDTDMRISEACKYEKETGSGVFQYIRNPLDPAKVAKLVEPFMNVHSLSLTGGEPLLYADFITELDVGLPLYLESNMTLPDMAMKVKDCVSFVSGDVKLTSEFRGEAFELHVERTIETFKVLRKTKNRDCFCKIVMTKDIDTTEVLNVIGSIRNFISCIVLQPVTQHDLRPDARSLLELQNELLGDIDTLIIPQTHRIWGCL